jgi:hypothetical protein
MTPRIARTIALIGTMSALGALGASAHAATWHSSGGSFTATSAGTTTLTVSGVTLSCSAATLSGVLSGTTGPVYPSIWAVDSEIWTYKPCVSGGVNYQIDCTSVFTAATHSTTSGTPPYASETTDGTMTTGAPCGIRPVVSPTMCRQISQTTDETETNVGVFGKFTLFHRRHTHTVTVSGSGACAVPTGSGTWSGATFSGTTGATAPFWISVF